MGTAPYTKDDVVCMQRFWSSNSTHLRGREHRREHIHIIPVLFFMNGNVKSSPFELIMEELRLADGHLTGLWIVGVSVPHTTKHVQLLSNATRYGTKSEENKALIHLHL